ncbi:MAG: hypothetical protein HQ567_17090 [Candidatus Nealsonbacteria bacterium]|nr:hypothetical protein [Candidatus Nealsonbacteria bacterium]
MIWFTSTGEKLKFEFDDVTGSFITPESIFGTLVKDAPTSGSYTWTDTAGNQTVFASSDLGTGFGRLQSIKDRFNNGIT